VSGKEMLEQDLLFFGNAASFSSEAEGKDVGKIRNLPKLTEPVLRRQSSDRSRQVYCTSSLAIQLGR